MHGGSKDPPLQRSNTGVERRRSYANVVEAGLKTRRRTARSAPWLFAIVLFVASATAACKRPSSGTPDQPPVSERVVTFNKDVAPILFEHCASCHRPIESSAGSNQATASTQRKPASTANDPLCVAGAPFSLLDYASAKAHAGEVAEATATRAMPPWLPEPDIRFAHERRLTDAQIATIQLWAQQGAPEGEASDRPAQPRWPDGWQLGTPDLVVTMPESYMLAAKGGDVFRNFVFPIPTAPPRFVRAIEFRADNPRVLHHANVSVDPARVARRLDRAEPEPGFAAMPDDQVQNVYGWSPGRVPVFEAADTAWTLEEGSDLAVQLHMVPTGTTETVKPAIGLYFSTTPPTRTPVVIKLESKSIDIPAGDATYVVEDRYVLPADVEAVSVYPHAHYLATQMKSVATLPNGATVPLLSITQWNIKWQDQYRYASPLFLPKGTTVSMRFVYDNSDKNSNNPARPSQRVLWGPKSSDEMGALWLEVIPRRPEDLALFEADQVARALRADVAGAETRVKATPTNAAAHNYLATKYLQAGRTADAKARFEEAIRLDPRNAEAHSNLGSVLQSEGRMDEAARHVREAVRLKPRDDRVRYNLGNLLLASGRPDEAMAEFRRAVAINPDNAEAHFNLAMLLGPRNRVDEAIEHLTRVLAISPRSPDAHRNLAIAYSLQGKLTEAIAHDRAALRLQPDSPTTRQHLESLLQAAARNRPSR
jgi:Flp pilus assembly protein TadD